MPIVDDAAFEAPPADYRPVAMWFLNGDLAEDEVRRQVRAMAAGGVGGIQVAARTGLTTPYLSDRWFALVGQVIDEARRHGMRVWLADEYPYPSGASGGEVILRHPEYRAWQMRARRVAAAPEQEVRAVAPGTVLLRACAVPVAGGVARWEQAIPLEGAAGIVQHQQVFYQPTRVFLTTRRYMTNGPRPTLHWRAPRAPAGCEGWEVWLIAAAEIERYKFFGAYVDLCNPDACRYFVETTYRRYLERLGPERFGQLAGFFVDESHPQNWSWRLPDFFRERCGYSLYDALPALWTDTGPQTARVRYDYRQTITDLFVESFHRPLAAWCRQHGVQLSLEVGSTRNVVQRHADVPGIDPGHDKVGVPLDEILTRELPSYRGNLGFPASLAAQTGKRRVLDELFHSVGWSLTLQDMKAMLDRAAVRGANLFAFHGFCYTIGGLKKWDAPPSEFDQNPYWPHFPRLAAYAGRLGYALSRGRRVAPVALVDPITSLWAHGQDVGAGPDEVARRLAGDWTYLMRELVAAQRPHDHIDPLLLAEATVDGGTLRVGEAAYRAVVLPPATTLERAAWLKLEEFAGAGGTVVACGLLPYEQIEPESDVVARCAAAFGVEPAQVRRDYERERPEQSALSNQAKRGAGGAVDVVRSGNFVLLRTAGALAGAGAAGALLDVLEAVAPAELRLLPAGGAAAGRDFLVAQRREGNEDLYLLVNAGMAERECEVALRLPAGHRATVRRLDLETGAAEALAASNGAATGEQRVRLTFPRHGAHLLLVERQAAGDGLDARDPAAATGATGTTDATSATGAGDSSAAGRRPAPRVLEVALDGEWRCAPAGDNVLRLDRFRLAVVAGGDDGLPDDGAPSPRAVALLDHAGAPVVEPKPLVNVLQDLERSGRAWPVRVEVAPAFGAPPLLRPKLPATAWYAASFSVRRRPPHAVLCLESEALSGEWALWVNGQRLGPDAFRPRRRWDVSNVEADVTELLRSGENEVLVAVRVVEPWDGLLDAVYLLGDFGVAHDAPGLPAIGEHPERVRWDDLFGGGAGGGYPYYAGTLHLTRQVALPEAGGEAVLRLPDEQLMFAGVAQLTVNGRELGTRPWAPYAWTVPEGVLAAGTNEVTLSVTNTLIGQLEGRRYDPQQREAVPIVQPEVREVREVRDVPGVREARGGGAAPAS